MSDLRHIHEGIIDNPDFNLTLAAKRDLRELCAWVESYRKDGQNVLDARNDEIERLQAKVDELEANRPSPDNDKILSNDLPTAITEYLRVCGPDLNYNAYHLLSEAALALAATEQGEKDGH